MLSIYNSIYDLGPGFVEACKHKNLGLAQENLAQQKQVPAKIPKFTLLRLVPHSFLAEQSFWWAAFVCSTAFYEIRHC